MLMAAASISAFVDRHPTVKMLALSFLVLIGTNLMAGPGLVDGYVFADDPSAAAYTPPADYSRNAGGGTNTVTRSGVGAYTVHMPGLGKPSVTGNVQVAAVGVGLQAFRCYVLGWSALAGAALDVEVRCTTLAGAAADVQFVVQYVRQP